MNINKVGNCREKGFLIKWHKPTDENDTRPKKKFSFVEKVFICWNDTRPKCQLNEQAVSKKMVSVQ